MFPEGSINMHNVFNGGSPPLYDPRDEHDSCGVGFVADISGRQSHMILDYALTSVINVTHRGALDADAKTGDGAGILTQIPSAIFYPEANRRGYHSDSPDDLAVAAVFLPRDNTRMADKCRSFLEEASKQHDLTVVGWRDVPIDPSVLGEKALATMPLIQHLLLGKPTEMSSPEFQRNLFLARKQAENSILQHKLIGSYILSMSPFAIDSDRFNQCST